MAQTSSAMNNPLSGNLGNQTFKNYAGKQVVVSRFRTTSAKGNGASYAQRLVRLALPNIVLAGSQLKRWLPYLFERNKYYATAYTHFISHNKNASLPVQPKEDIEQKYCHWGKLVVGCGSLPSIPCQWTRHGFDTFIPLSGHIDVNTTTLGWLSAELIKNRSDLRPGDYIFLVSARTLAHQDNNLRWVYITTPTVGYFVLDPSSSYVLSDITTLSGILLMSLDDDHGNYTFGVGGSNTYSLAVVHVRKVGTRYLSSTSSMSLGSSAAQYASEAVADSWIKMCASSYGYKDDII